MFGLCNFQKEMKFINSNAKIAFLKKNEETQKIKKTYVVEESNVVVDIGELSSIIVLEDENTTSFPDPTLLIIVHER